MHQFVSGNSIVTLSRHPSGSGSAGGSGGGAGSGGGGGSGTSGGVTYTTDSNATTLITTSAAAENAAAAAAAAVNMTTLGSHFLTHTDTRDIDPTITKIEVEPVPVEVVVKKKEVSEGEKKVCLWPTGSGMSCGKTFTKFDSLKRHLAEAHKGLRPYQCTLCDKSYGRRDYLQRHLKSHNANYAVNLAGGGGGGGTIQQQQQPLSNVISKVQVSSKPNILVQVQQQPPPPAAAVVSPTTQSVVVQQQQQQQSVVVQQQPQQQNPLPLFNVQLTGAPVVKPGGSKICRWVQNDGTVCGKAFSKLDSLRRHVTELHKGVRPYACNLCDKNYGRRDYLERHMRTHDANNANKRKAGPIDWGPNSGVGSLSITATGGGGGGGGGQDQINTAAGSVVPRVPKKKRKDIPAEEKKICLWVLEDGTACGKTFTKFDSLKRHVSEAHKGIRPFACTLCGKNYGRRDYLLRHLKSHNESEAANLATTSGSGGGGGGGTRVAVTNPSQLVGHVIGNTGTTVNFTPAATVSVASGPPAAVLQQVAQAVSHPQIVRTVTSQAPASVIAAIHNQQPALVQQHHPQQQQQQQQQQQPQPQPATVVAAAPPPVVTTGKKRSDDKKTCRWVLENGTVCGRSFSKFDSLRRHVQELHKGIRPFVCTLCDKSYGRRDYLQRHMKSHDSNNTAAAGGSAAGSAGGGGGTTTVSTAAPTTSGGGGTTTTTVVVTQ